MELAQGTTLLGKYRVEEVLGTGGMGRVIRASHLYLQQSVAIKILLQHMVESPSTVARFLREAQACAGLRSEHIARVIDVGTLSDGTPYMVMEYLEGNDLNQILRHYGPQSPNIVCDLMLQACEGIAEAHALGIVHRDVKPSNFFITKRPDGSMLLKILDFGISKTPVGFEELTGTQTVIGTPSYMAPEQMKSGKAADMRSDIWSMGVVMYQLLQGRGPFAGETYTELVLKVTTEAPAPLHVPLPAGLGEVIFRCFEKDPKARQQNVGELARMIAPYASDPITAAQIAARTTRILQSRASQQNVGGNMGREVLPISAGGGLTTPAPLSPAQLTPRSWPPSTSTSQGKGQVTYQSGASRGWIVAGALSLAILAGAGGFIASNLMKDDSAASQPESPATETPTPTEPDKPVTEAAGGSNVTKPQPTIPDPKVETTTDTKVDAKTVKPDTKTDAKTTTKIDAKTDAKTTTKIDAKTDAKTMAKTDPKVDAKTTDPKVDTKTIAVKTDPKTTAKTDPKTTTKKTDTKKTDSKKTDTKKTDTKKTDTNKTTTKKGGNIFDDRH